MTNLQVVYYVSHRCQLIWDECITNVDGGMIGTWPRDVMGQGSNKSFDLNNVPGGLNVVLMPQLL